MIFFGLISGSVAIGSLIGFIGIVASMIAYTFVGYAGFFEMFEFTPFYIGWVERGASSAEYGGYFRPDDLGSLGCSV